MLWQNRQGSSNVEDRRGVSGGGLVAGGGVIGVIILLINLFMGDGDVSQIPQILNNGTQQTEQLSPAEKEADDQRAKFVSVVLNETELVWNKLLSQSGETYTPPKLVLFRDEVTSACGGATSASGPFYCPGDRKVYIDLAFYQELTEKFRAPGDFAMAYVIAHEVGHHIQSLTGASQKVSQLRGQLSETEYNKYSVMLELQADFYAGIWAHYADKDAGIVEKGDVNEALNAASVIGDDHLQKQSRGTINPDGFTHGTSAQRVYWFKKGYETGDISQGDTFKDPSLQ